MWEWLTQNKQWVFSGAGIAAFGALWWFVTKFLSNREATQAPAPATTTQAPSTTIAPVITMNPTINIPVEPRAPEPPKQIVPSAPTAPKPRPNLCVEGIKMGRISLEGDIWTLREPIRSHIRPNRALLADVSNVPTDSAHTAKAAIRAAIRMGQQRTYSPLPWLEEYSNKVYLGTGERKTVVVAVGEDSQTGAWTFVLNHRSDYSTPASPSAMDWTNLCPIPSDLPFEIVMIDMSSEAILTKFVYRWTFDTNRNWPFLKSVD
jgi:hypothetical protein